MKRGFESEDECKRRGLKVLIEAMNLLVFLCGSETKVWRENGRSRIRSVGYKENRGNVECRG